MKPFKYLGDMCSKGQHDKCSGGGGFVVDNSAAPEWICTCECHKSKDLAAYQEMDGMGVFLKKGTDEIRREKQSKTGWICPVCGRGQTKPSYVNVETECGFSHAANIDFLDCDGTSTKFLDRKNSLSFCTIS